MSLRTLVMACVAMGAWASSASVYDDAFWWFNGPVETSSGTAGLLETGEVVNILRGGNASDTTHQSESDNTRKQIRVVNGETITTHYFSKSLPYVSFGTQVGGANVIGFINASTAFNNAYTKGDGFSAVLRLRYDSAKQAPGGSQFLFTGSGFEFGFSGSYLRIYPGESGGITAVPISNNVWYDIGFAITPTETGSHFSCLLVKADGTRQKFEKDYATGFCPQVPTAGNSTWCIGAEGPWYNNLKYFTGDLQQLACWNRTLSFDEMEAAFKVQPPDPVLVGASNGSGAEFGGASGSVTLDLDSVGWSAVPKIFRASDVWTLTFNHASDAPAKPRALKVKSAFGAATFSATLNGRTSTASATDGGTAELFLNTSSFVAGANTLTLSRTDGGADFTLDALSLDVAPYQEEVITCTADAMDFQPHCLMEDWVRVYDVAEGVTMYVDGIISGLGGVVKRGPGTLVLTGANSYSCGTTVERGVLDVRNAAALGTGTVTVQGSQEHANQIKFNASGATFANPLVFETASTTNYPALMFEVPTILSGGVIAHANLYLATGYSNSLAAANQAHVKFLSPVTVDEGCRLAGAPHCIVSFERGYTLPILEGYYTTGAGANGGNAGAFRLMRDDTTHNRGSIGRIILDQTRILCGNSNVADGSILEFTGAHPVNGYGYIDLNGGQHSFAAVCTGSACATATEGLQILNSSTTVSSLAIGNTGGTANWYFVLDGLINLGWNTLDPRPNFLNRHHTMQGSLSFSKSYMVGAGAAFPNVTSFSGSSGAAVHFESNEPDLLNSVKTVTCGSCKFNLNTAAAVASAGQGHKLRIVSNRATTIDGKSVSTGDKAYGVFVKEGETMDIASAYVHPANSVHDLVEVPCGEYTVDDYCEFCRGTFRVWAPRTSWTDVTWSGADDAALGDTANWTPTTAGAAVPSFSLPLANATIGGGARATVTGLVNFGGLNFSADAGDFTFNGTGLVALYDHGFSAVKGSADRTITFNVPVDEQSGRGFVVPAGDTLVFAAGVTNAVNGTVATNLVVIGGALSQLQLGGIVPTSLTLNGGSLAFTANATVPVDAVDLVLAEGSKIVVPEGTTLRLKSLTYAGAAVDVGYFTSANAAFVSGGGRVRVATSTAAQPVELVWTANADGDMAMGSNWNTDDFDFSFPNKYGVRFSQTSAAGTRATVSGDVNLRAITFDTAHGFTLAPGTDGVLRLAGSIATTNVLLDGLSRDYVIDAPIVLDGNVDIDVAEKDTLTIRGGVTGTGNITKRGLGRFNFFGTNDFTGNLYHNVSNCGLVVLSGELKGEGALHVNANQLDCCCYSNVVVRKSPQLSFPSVSPPTLPSYAVRFSWFDVPAHTTNEITGQLPESGATGYLTAGKDGRMTIRGGLSNTSKVTVRGGGDITFADSPLLCFSRSNDGFVEANGSGTVFGLDADKCKLAQLFTSSDGMFDFRRTGVLPEEYALSFQGNYMLSRLNCKNGTGTFNFNRTVQYVSVAFGNQSVLTGDYGAILVVKRGGASASDDNAKLSSAINGGLSIKMDGEQKDASTGYWTLSGAKDSCGDVYVNKGVLEFASDASWLNGTNVVVTGGTLRLTASEPFNRECVAMNISGGGKIELANGARQHVASLSFDGVPQAKKGSYGADKYPDYISGTGVLIIPGGGTLLIIK